MAKVKELPKVSKAMNVAFVRAIFAANQLNRALPAEEQVRNYIGIANAIAQTGLVSAEVLSEKEVDTLMDDANVYAQNVVDQMITRLKLGKKE